METVKKSGTRALYKSKWAHQLREWWMRDPERHSQIAKEIISHLSRNSFYKGMIWDWLYQRYRYGYTYPQIYKMWETVDEGTINVYIRDYSRKLLRELKARNLL